MSDNYVSARYALSLVLRVVCDDSSPAVESVLPADSRYSVCSPQALCSALGQCGILANVVIVDYPDRARVLSETIARGYLSLCLYGLHSAPADQRWYTLFDMDDCGGYDWVYYPGGETMGRLHNAHFCSSIIVVRGRKRARPPRC